MRNSKLVSRLCLLVILFNFVPFPPQAANADGSDIPFMDNPLPFHGHLAESILSASALPSGRNNYIENIYADDENRVLNFWEPTGGKIHPIELVRGEKDGLVPPSQDTCMLTDDIGSSLYGVSECRKLPFRREVISLNLEQILPVDTDYGNQTRAPGTCTVTSTADSGAGSFRACLTAAGTGDLILFDPIVFSPIAPQTIFLTSELPGIVVDGLTVDASNAGVILDGGGVAGDSFGLVIWNAQGVTVMGLQITNFTLGMLIGGGASQNTIGGNRAIGAGPIGQGNRISGNTDTGIWLQNIGTKQNTIKGNLLGTNLAGNSAHANGYAGILVFAGASENIIGGSHSAGVCNSDCNLISGNIIGIHFESTTTQNNQVTGNFIGTNLQGNSAIQNVFSGIALLDSPSNLIGGEHSPSVCDGPCNLISGNTNHGIYLDGQGVTNNSIKGNFIGTNNTGDAALGNGFAGIVLLDDADENIIGGPHNAGVCDGPCNLISGNTYYGIFLENVLNNSVKGNFIGTNFSGFGALGNGFAGIILLNDAEENIVGGSHSAGVCDGECNLISGNNNHGVYLENASHNLIKGNFIGTDATGVGAVGNVYSGIVFVGGAKQNTIGGFHSPGVCDGDCNLVSGNLVGIQIEGAMTSGNQVKGNFIGTNPLGSGANPNKDVGLLLWGAPGNLIGGALSPGVCDGPCNLISGNTNEGLIILGVNAKGNIMQGNFIGTNVAGSAPLSNNHGLVMASGTSENQVGGAGLGEGNLISGNTNFGIWISQSSGNHILGNRIGTNFSGLASVPNYHGLLIAGSPGNHIGGVVSGEGNLISGNDNTGIYIEDDSLVVTGTTIAGNLIGTNQAGTAALSNYRGILLSGGRANLINSNLISGNTEVGILMNTSSDNQVQGNTIGANLTGNAMLSNGAGIVINFGGSNNLIGGSGAGTGNLISGNFGEGVFIQNVNSIGNQVLGNRIGTNASGTSVLPNGDGILVLGASGTIIGGADLTTPWICDGACNLISGNNSFGIMIQGVSASGLEPPGVVVMNSQVSGNFIGTNLAGTSALPNLAGVDLSWQTGGNLIGGNRSLREGNLISGNQVDGVVIRGAWAEGNQVAGNRIGTTADGNNALPNGLIGVRLYGGASNNLIGGAEAVMGNLISGNGNAGIGLIDESTKNNQVYYNFIGTNSAGTSAVPNLVGIGLLNLVSNTDIQGNLISGNSIRGVDITTGSNNHFRDNYIGVAADGLSPLPNGEDGIVLFSAPNNSFGPGNILANNRVGIAIVEPESVGNTITQNSIYANTSFQIAFFNTEPLVPAPLLVDWDDATMTVTGTACVGCNVEVFASPSAIPAGRIYLGSTVAAVDGSFSLMIGAGQIYLAATATDAVGTTSEFSDTLQVGEEVLVHMIYLPLMRK